MENYENREIYEKKLLGMTDAEAQSRLGKIGLVAGNGNFPRLFVESMVANRTPFAVAGLRGFVDERVAKIAQSYEEFFLTDFGKITRFFKREKVETVVIIGGVDKRAMRFNLHVLQMLIRLQFYKKKNDGIFRIIISKFEEKGFRVVGVQDAMPSLLTPPGLLTKTKPSQQNLDDVNHAIVKCREWGEADKGQALVMLGGVVLGREGEVAHGTDALMDLCLKAKNGEHGGVMAKLVKNGQEERGDIPAIGFKTIEQLIHAKLNGIVVDAGYKTIIEEKEKLAEFADEHGIFILAV